MELILICPHCNEPVIISKLNCKIFRHGVYKTTLKQVNPHMSEDKLNTLINSNKIYGCGKPFKIIEENGKYKIFKCEYI